MHHEPREEQTPGGFPVAAVLHIKNLHLHRAAQRLGSQKRLADLLGVTQNTISAWITLKSCPPATPNQHWSQRRIDRLERRLVEATGATLDEVFPQAIRDNVEFLRSPKTFERTVHIRAAALEDHARRTRERIEAQADPALNLELQERSSLLQDLLQNSRLSENELKTVRLLHPEHGRAATLEEAADRLHTTIAAVMRNRQKAIQKMRMAAGARHRPAILDAIPRDTRRPEVIDPTPPPKPEPPEQTPEERKELAKAGSQAEQEARASQGTQRREGLLTASWLYRKAGLDLLADDLEREAGA